MQDISGQGLQANIVASNTFPQGFNVTQFADDTDPLDIASIQLAEEAMGLNGDLVVWSKATPIPVVIGVVPGSDDDVNLSVLAEANRVGKGKISAKDEITMVITYPNGNTVTLSPGIIRDAMRGNSVASAGRNKSKVYTFRFENMTEV